jgi:large subunit ribosomal protein L13
LNKDTEQSNKTTTFAKTSENRNHWVIADATDKVLGRFAAEVAKIIRGKNYPKFTPNADTGDCVIVLNAGKIRVTGKRATLKEYRRHSMYPGGEKKISFRELISKNPEKVIRLAVRGMLPKSRLGDRLIRKLKVYAGSEHPHAAQNPETLKI